MVPQMDDISHLSNINATFSQFNEQINLEIHFVILRNALLGNMHGQ
jgi:hypothetical protein